MPEFFVLRDKCLGEKGYVSHISFNGYSAIVSHTSVSYVAILFERSDAEVIVRLLESLEHECYGYDIVPFKDAPCS